MPIIAALFDGQAEATQALDALAESRFADVETTVIEADSNEAEGPGFAAAIVPGTSSVPRAAVLFNVSPLNELDIEEQQFFVAGVRRGGVVVVAEAESDADATELAAFFAEHGGRTEASS